MENYHLIRVKFISPKNTRGSRIKISSYRFAEEGSMTLGYDHAIGDIAEQAEKYLTERGFEIVGRCEYSAGSYGLISTTFKAVKG